MPSKDASSLWEELIRDPSKVTPSKPQRRPLRTDGSPSTIKQKPNNLNLFRTTPHRLPRDAKGPVPRLGHRDRVSLLTRIKLCRKHKNLQEVRELYNDALKKDLIRNDVFVATALITTYAKCGALDEAREVFENISVQDVFSWTALIAGYVQNRQGHEALACSRRMRDAGIRPDAITYISILQACGIVGSLEIGEEIEAEVRKQGLLAKDVSLGTALVDMYAKCGTLGKARDVLEELPVRNVVTWSTLIAGYTRHGLGDEALKCFQEMQDVGVYPDAVTYAYILKACGLARSLVIGQDIDMDIRKRGWLEKDVVLGTALVDMYAKCGALDKAREVFDNLPSRDVVSWNAIISGYAQNGLGREALKCLRCMQDARVQPDAVTYISSLKACGIVGSLEIGEDIEADARKQGLLEKDVALGNALVDMYAKCGVVKKAKELFEKLPVRNVVAWSALISGYAQLGQANMVLDLHRKMSAEGVVPDSVTFVVLLTACNHAGLVEEAERLFNEMCDTFHLVPKLEHYNCMIDLFGRVGHLHKAKVMLDKASVENPLSLFLSLLSACRKWKNVNLGRWAFEQCVRLDEKCAAAYVCMGNVYAAVGMRKEAEKIEALKVKNKASKFPLGHAWWTDANRTVHSFIGTDPSHPQTKDIHAKLQEINKKLSQVGYSLDSEDTLDDEMCDHSERLAIACALINNKFQGNAPIRVTTNMRICRDCHSATALVSMIEKCRIQVNDVERVHIFGEGRCICESCD